MRFNLRLAPHIVSLIRQAAHEANMGPVSWAQAAIKSRLIEEGRLKAEIWTADNPLPPIGKRKEGNGC